MMRRGRGFGRVLSAARGEEGQVGDIDTIPHAAGAADDEKSEKRMGVQSK